MSPEEDYQPALHRRNGSLPLKRSFQSDPAPTGKNYFLWHFLQFAGSLALKALVPLWQTPQN